MEKSGNMNHVSANNEHHVPLHVKPIRSKKGDVTDVKIEIKSTLYRIRFYGTDNHKFYSLFCINFNQKLRE